MVGSVLKKKYGYFILGGAQGVAGPVLKQKLWPSGRAQRGVFFTCFYMFLHCPVVSFFGVERSSDEQFCMQPFWR